MLRYDGTQPVNVAHFIAVMVVVQIALLVSLGISAVLPGGPHRALRRFLSKKSQTARAASRALGRAESWAALGLAQLFGLAFNAGVLGASLATVTFTDLAFSWSTTLELSVDQVHALTSALAAPWSAFWPAAVPSRELVETTQYYRLLQTGFVRPGAPVAYGAWWPFLVAAVLAYGFLPRLVLLTLATFAGRATRRAALRGNLETQRLIARVRAAASDADPAEPADARLGTSVAPAKARQATRAAVILWRDLPFAEPVLVQLVKAATGASAAFVRSAGGKALDLDGAAAAKAVGAAPELAAEAPVVIVVDLFSALDKALLRFVAGMRAALGAKRPLLILPLASKGETPMRATAEGAAKLAQWRRAVREQADPALDLAE